MFVGVAPEGPLMECLEAAHDQVDDLITEVFYHGTYTAFTLVDTHYDGVNFGVVGSGYARNCTSDELTQLGEMVAPGA